MQGEFKILIRLLGIEPNEVPMKFEKGKPLFDGDLYEVKANLLSLNEKLEEGLVSIRDSMKRSLIANHGLRFLKQLEEALRDYFGRNGNK